MPEAGEKRADDFSQNIVGLDLRTAEGDQDPRACTDCDGIILASDGAVVKLPGRKQIKKKPKNTLSGQKF